MAKINCWPKVEGGKKIADCRREAPSRDRPEPEARSYAEAGRSNLAKPKFTPRGLWKKPHLVEIIGERFVTDEGALAPKPVSGGKGESRKYVAEGFSKLITPVLESFSAEVGAFAGAPIVIQISSAYRKAGRNNPHSSGWAVDIIAVGFQGQTVRIEKDWRASREVFRDIARHQEALVKEKFGDRIPEPAERQAFLAQTLFRRLIEKKHYGAALFVWLARSGVVRNANGMKQLIAPWNCARAAGTDTKTAMAVKSLLPDIDIFTKGSDVRTHIGHSAHVHISLKSGLDSDGKLPSNALAARKIL